jgi:hypothetical protein
MNFNIVLHIVVQLFLHFSVIRANGNASSKNALQSFLSCGTIYIRLDSFLIGFFIKLLVELAEKISFVLMVASIV